MSQEIVPGGIGPDTNANDFKLESELVVIKKKRTRKSKESKPREIVRVLGTKTKTTETVKKSVLK